MSREQLIEETSRKLTQLRFKSRMLEEQQDKYKTNQLLKLRLSNNILKSWRLTQQDLFIKLENLYNSFGMD